MRRRTRNLRNLKTRRYADSMIELNKYLSVFPGENSSEKIGEIELNEIILNSMPNRRGKQAQM